ncbi:hypothetical protein OAJ98_03525, partial [Deltaproteobacteria bacterium]|nr:hypothetical protein [Deltaproteobacteria bacterium]
SDIDFHNKTITVRSGKKGQYPTIPMNEMAEKVLAEHGKIKGRRSAGQKHGHGRDHRSSPKRADK